jgi:chorismate synthase
MSHNTFGHLFRVTTWGESHGPAIGGVVDGMPAGIALSAADIQPYLDQRRPGQSQFTTQRREPDQVRIMSGVYEGRTTGTPIALMIENTDQRSKDYANIAAQYRPGHADVAYDMKYGHRDPRGGGRSSARETAMRVAAGAIARLLLPAVRIRGALVAMGPHAVDRSRWDWGEVARNPFFCPDATAAAAWAPILDAVRKDGSSLGAVIELVAEGVAPGLGAPIYGKLDAEIAGALMSINAVKGVEIGDGFAAAGMVGQKFDAATLHAHLVGILLAAQAGGVLGGISTGQPIVARFAVKPTSSILTPVRSVSAAGEDVELMTKGRHDPCVGIRAVPVGEAMLACVLADHALRAHAQKASFLTEV